jgi:hypothetical protein
MIRYMFLHSHIYAINCVAVWGIFVVPFYAVFLNAESQYIVKISLGVSVRADNHSHMTGSLLIDDLLI